MASRVDIDKLAKDLDNLAEKHVAFIGHYLADIQSEVEKLKPFGCIHKGNLDELINMIEEVEQKLDELII
jgi:hypothetical protein